MPCFLLLFVLVLGVEASFGQDQTPVDSLLRVVETLPVSEAFERLMEEVMSVKQNDLQTAQTLAQVAYDLALSQDWKEEEIEALNELASASYLMGDYEKTMTWNELRTDYYVSIGDSVGLAKHLNMVANNLRKLNQQDRGHQLLDRARRICEAADESECLSINYDHRGLLYMDVQAWDQALDAFETCLAIREATQDTVGLGYIYDRLSQVYAVTQRFDEAVAMGGKSLQIRQQLNDELNIGINLNNIGEIYLMKGEPQEALAYFDRALPISKKVKFTDLTRHLYEYQSRAWLQVGEYEAAYGALAQSYALKDSLLNAETVAAMLDIQAKYDTERKQRQLDQQRAQNQLLLVGSGSVILVLVLGAVIGFLFYRSRQEAAVQQREHAYQKGLLQATLRAEETERRRIARDLHDGIGQHLVGLNMEVKSLAHRDDHSQDYLSQFSSSLSDITKEVRLLSHHMMPPLLEEAGLAAALEDTFQKSFEAAGIVYHYYRPKPMPTVNNDVTIGLFRVVQELVSNILKHAGATTVDITLLVVKDMVVLTVEDDGKGFDPAGQYAGLGLLNIKSRVQALNGRLLVEQQPSGGMQTIVRVPFQNEPSSMVEASVLA